MFRVPGLPPNVDGTCRLDRHDLDFWERVTKTLCNSGERARGSGSHEDPIDLFELVDDFICRFRGMNILVSYVVVLIEPDGIRFRL